MSQQLLSSYARMFATSNVALAVIDGTTLEIVFSNDAFLRFFKEMQLISGRSMLHEFEPLSDALSTTLASSELVVHEWPHANARLEFSAAHAGAQGDADDHRLVQCVVLPLPSHGTALDVASPAPPAPLASEAYRRILDHFPHNVWLCTVSGELFWTNRTSNLFTYGRAEFHDPDSSAYITKIHPDDLTGAGVALSKAMQAGHMETPYRYRLRDHAGNYHWFQFTMAPVLDWHGEPTYWVGTSINIQHIHDAEQQALAELKALQRRCESNESRLISSERLVAQQHKMELVAHLAGGVAHDLNNLLHVMGINIELMQPLVQQEALQRHMRILEGCIKKAGRLSTQLAGFSGRLPQNAVALDPAVLVEDIRELLSRAVGAEIELCIVIEGQPHAVLADKSYLENALINLAINARDAMDGRGSVTLRVANQVEAGADGQQRDHVVFSLQDEGSGMSAAVRERIFDPFFTTKAPDKGTGLGLPMVRTFVENSGGHITVESVEGQGSCVSIHLPRTEQAPEAAVIAQPSPHTMGQGRILLVEDDRNVRDAMNHILTRLGYDTIPSFSFDHAVKLLEGGMRPDLIVSDVRMPGRMSINDLIGMVETVVPVPLIFVTGYSAEVVVKEGLIHDKYPVLFKPFSAQEISARIRDMLEARSLGPDPHAVA